MEENTLTKQQLQRASRLLGMMTARTALGDSYDVLEEFAEGWAYVISGAAEETDSAAYTTPVNSGPGADVDGDGHFTADQAWPAPTTKEQLRLQLAILADLRAAIDSVIEWRVEDARAGRWSWAEIAEPLEISKQGAHQRYGVDRIRSSQMPKV